MNITIFGYYLLVSRLHGVCSAEKCGHFIRMTQTARIKLPSLYCRNDTDSHIEHVKSIENCVAAYENVHGRRFGFVRRPQCEFGLKVQSLEMNQNTYKTWIIQSYPMPAHTKLETKSSAFSIAENFEIPQNMKIAGYLTKVMCATERAIHSARGWFSEGNCSRQNTSD